jgi:hypothetical protein
LLTFPYQNYIFCSLPRIKKNLLNPPKIITDNQIFRQTLLYDRWFLADVYRSHSEFIQLLLLVLVITFMSNISSVYSVPSSVVTQNVTEIRSEAFGNNGMRFKSFVECPNHVLKLFDGGSHLRLSASISNIKKSNNAVGLWQMEYKDGANPYLQASRGKFSGGFVDGDNYTLFGTETANNVCHGPPSNVIIRGGCGNNTPVFSKYDDGREVGSTVPPNSHKIYYLVSSNTFCTNK